MTFTAARWSAAGWEEVDKADGEGKIFGAMQCKDRWGRPVLLFRNEWKMSQVADEAPYLELVPWMMAPEEE
jgi:peptide chain release factor 3